MKKNNYIPKRRIEKEEPPNFSLKNIHQLLLTIDLSFLNIHHNLHILHILNCTRFKL